DLYLIVENDFRDFEYEIIQEQVNDKKYPKFKIKGPYALSDTKNKNKRIYPEKILDTSINEYIENVVKTSNAFGEMNHPTREFVDYERACHLVNNLQKDGKVWIGESIVLTSSGDGVIKGTPQGDILASIIQHGGRPGISSRGVGKLDDKSNTVTEFKLIAFDCVSNPSTPGAFVDGILESKKFMIDEHGMILEQSYDRFEQEINNLPKKTDERNEKMIKAINEFINSLSLKNK
ncbi:MAG: hypothetical protein D6834_03220, partial [Aquificota bacterium]